MLILVWFKLFVLDLYKMIYILIPFMRILVQNNYDAAFVRSRRLCDALLLHIGAESFLLNVYVLHVNVLYASF